MDDDRVPVGPLRYLVGEPIRVADPSLLDRYSFLFFGAMEAT
jgi:hypothetical protein